MMNIDNEKLWAFVRGLSDPEEHKAIEKQLQSDEGLRKRFDALSLLDKDIRSSVRQIAPEGFADRFIAGFSAPVNEESVVLKSRVNVNIIRALFLFFIFGIVTCLTLILMGGITNTQTYFPGSEQFSLILDFMSSEIVMQTVLGIFGFCVLVLFDRIMLYRPQRIH